MEYNGKIVAERIKTRRQECNLTQNALANNAGINVTTLISIEQNKTKPRTETIMILSDALNCEVGYLLGEYDLPTRAITDICKETGLSQKAVEALRNDSDRHTADFTSLFIEHSHDIIKAVEDEIRAVEMEKIWRDCPDYPIIKKCFEHGERNARKAGRVINVYYGDTAETILKDAKSLYYQYNRAENWCIGYTEKGERNEDNLHRVLRYLLDKAKRSERLFTLQETFLGVVKEYISNETKGEST